MKRIAFALTLALALPLAVTAQGQQGHDMNGGMMQGPEMMHSGMIQEGMHGAMMTQPGPGMLLRLQETLGLSEEQVAQLEAMHEEARTAMQEHQEAARSARMQAHHAMMGDTPDLSAFESALEEAAMHDVQATVAMARVHVQAGDVLTEEQQATLATLIQGMHEMQGEGMHPMGEGMGEGMQQRRQERMHRSGS